MAGIISKDSKNGIDSELILIWVLILCAIAIIAIVFSSHRKTQIIKEDIIPFILSDLTVRTGMVMDEESFSETYLSNNSIYVSFYVQEDLGGLDVNKTHHTAQYEYYEGGSGYRAEIVRITEYKSRFFL